MCLNLHCLRISKVRVLERPGGGDIGQKAIILFCQKIGYRIFCTLVFISKVTKIRLMYCTTRFLRKNRHTQTRVDPDHSLYMSSLARVCAVFRCLFTGQSVQSLCLARN